MTQICAYQENNSCRPGALAHQGRLELGSPFRPWSAVGLNTEPQEGTRSDQRQQMAHSKTPRVLRFTVLPHHMFSGSGPSSENREGWMTWLETLESLLPPQNFQHRPIPPPFTRWIKEVTVRGCRQGGVVEPRTVTIGFPWEVGSSNFLSVPVVEGMWG